jgi:DNA helicase HerA-like ATPase
MDFEQLGLFYLGAKGKTAEGSRDLVLYDSRHLTTHAVVVGMTGSGKTGLCIDLLEEAAIDGVPVIAIDPKGDIADILLTFPSLAPSDFAPWVDAGEAERSGKTPQAYAEDVAARWRKGLADWGMDAARIGRLRDAADFSIYTPGSSAGLPLSVLRSLSAPKPEAREDAELMRERIATTVAGLLGMVGINADAKQSREHILLTALLEREWQLGRDVSLEDLIHAVQNPPIAKIGVLDLETFYPAKERFELVLALNNLLGSSGYTAWMEGEPLDVGALFVTKTGKPRVSILSIAHLGDAERMFFVTLFLNQVLAWMRAQPGTSSLRAIVYMDEIFGYFPPVQNPPSKKPLLTLLKQARAFGLGVVLATQNPVDLDYKGLANAGTWFIGRLQTERDQARVLDGLADAGANVDRAGLQKILTGLEQRHFLMSSVHADGPLVIESRFALSYLRGPLTRAEIKKLMDEKRAATGQTPAVAPAANAGPAAASAPSAPSAGARPPALPPEVTQFYLPTRRAAQGPVYYAPVVLGVANVTFSDAKASVDATLPLTYVTPITEEAVPVDFQRALPSIVAMTELLRQPQPGIVFMDLPANAVNSKNIAAWTKDFKAYLATSAHLDLFRSPAAKLISRPGESEADFRLRLRQSTRESRDTAVDELSQKYTPKIAALDERIRKAEQAKARQSEESRSAQLSTAISVGAALLGALAGKSVLSRGNVGRAATAARSVGRVSKEASDVAAAQDNLDALVARRKELEADLAAETAQIDSGSGPLVPLETYSVKPKKTGIDVRLVSLAWVPGVVQTSGVFEALC